MKLPPGLSGAVLLADPNAPNLATEVELLAWLAADCGAEGFTIDEKRGRLHALRWRDGVAETIRAYEFDVFDGGKQ